MIFTSALTVETVECQVARELVISIKTVEYHLGHVYAKLGVASRSRLAARLATDAPPPR